MQESNTRKKIGFISLGCPKNRVDSEVMLGQLAAQGYQISPSEEEAEVLVVNTCGFIEPAKEESIRTILEMVQRKKDGLCKRVVVTGCLVERYRREIEADIPEVDALLGVNELERIAAICDPDSAGQRGIADEFVILDNGGKSNGTSHSAPLVDRPSPTADHRSDLYLYNDQTPRLLSTPGHYAYIKIAEGCDHACAFCIIPALRGYHRSRPIDSIVREAQALAGRGVRELNLVSQDTTRYGQDQGLEHGLARLLEHLARVDGIEWIRVHYTYPNSLDMECIDVMAREPKICPYLDMPLQHASASVLKAMRRGGNRRMLEEMLARVRERVPHVALRTTMIVGFPGETEEDFSELMDFCKEMQFRHLGVFTYFDEEGTPAYDLEPKVPDALKQERRRLLMAQQARISRRKNREWVGQTIPVLVEGPSEESDLLVQGRACWQAPEIDGCVLITDSAVDSLVPGRFYSVKITRALDHDLIGRVIS